MCLLSCPECLSLIFHLLVGLFVVASVIYAQAETVCSVLVHASCELCRTVLLRLHLRTEPYRFYSLHFCALCAAFLRVVLLIAARAKSFPFALRASTQVARFVGLI